MEIMKVLVMSTAHLKPDTYQSIHNNETCATDLYGVFVWVETETEHEDLYSALSFATKNGCSYVKFDEDGEVMEELKTYK